jgi:hypothetical protein
MPPMLFTLPPSTPAAESHCTCGYNLQGLPPTHACPECGNTALSSLPWQFLWNENPSRLRKIRRGFIWLTVVYLIVQSVSIAAFCVLSNLEMPNDRFPLILPSLTLFAGSICLAGHTTGPATKTRMWLILLAALQPIGTIFKIMILDPMGPARTLNTQRGYTLLVLIWIAWVIALCFRMRYLAHRTNARWLARWCLFICAFAILAKLSLELLYMLFWELGRPPRIMDWLESSEDWGVWLAILAFIAGGLTLTWLWTLTSLAIQGIACEASPRIPGKPWRGINLRFTRGLRSRLTKTAVTTPNETTP